VKAHYDEKNHSPKNGAKLDAMFFTASEEPTVLKGQETLENKLLDDMEDYSQTPRI
jgi:hypothetical protein